MAEEATTSPKAKKTASRSAAYPGLSLQEAVEATKLLRENSGQGPYSRESAAIALGYAGVSGASGTKVAACVHFGLLTKESNSYRQSALADKIFTYISEDEKVDALKAAVQKPTLYAKLITEFNGKPLPKMLANLLARNHGITEKAAKEAAATFIKSAEYAGILTNGIISTAGSADAADPQDQTDEEEDSSAGSPQGNGGATGAKTPPPRQPDTTGYLPVTIPGTQVKILFPTEFAYDLSVGNFKEGIEKLAENIENVRPAVKDDEPTPTAQI